MKTGCSPWKSGMGGLRQDRASRKDGRLRDLRIFSDVSLPWKSLSTAVKWCSPPASTQIAVPDGEAGEGYLHLQGDCRVKGSVYRLSEIIMEKRGDSGAESSENMVVTK